MALFQASSPPEKLVPAPPGEGRDTPIAREELVVASAPRSALAEQFRRLRNSLHALNPEGASRTVLLTSALEGEGKSVATLNLGLALAELPQVRVLAVDANPAHPSLERYLELPRRQGLQDVLAGKLDLEAAIRPTAAERFDLLGAGSVPQGPALDVDRVRSLLHSLKRRYDYVLVDGPAALAQSHAGVLGSLVDGILIVVRLGRTPKEAVAGAHRMLEELGGNVLGTCATGAEEL
jgi:capsular exopolysaccharide synthesis family protein